MWTRSQNFLSMLKVFIGDGRARQKILLTLNNIIIFTEGHDAWSWMHSLPPLPDFFLMQTLRDERTVLGSLEAGSGHVHWTSTCGRRQRLSPGLGACFSDDGTLRQSAGLKGHDTWTAKLQQSLWWLKRRPQRTWTSISWWILETDRPGCESWLPISFLVLHESTSSLFLCCKWANLRVF